MAYQDLREWIALAETQGDVIHLDGVHWNLEMGAIAELAGKGKKNRPLLVFDNIPDYPSGFRVITGMISSIPRLALTLGMPTDLDGLGFVEAWRTRRRELRPLPPREVTDGPILENVLTGDDIDLSRFPAPFWHEHDGGRYIGTADLVITADPDTGWCNVGTYRVMAYDRNSLGMSISPGKHGRIQRDKYFARGEPCPVAISFGHDPLLFVVSSLEIPFGQSEYEYAGAIKGQPIEVIRGPVTGLPIPAHAELVVEGEMVADDLRDEGPFGEWTGYYASGVRPQPVVRVKSVLHRNQPINTGAPPIPPPSGTNMYRGFLRAGLVWDQLEAAGIPDVRAVRSHEYAGHRFLTIVAIRQRYPGHAKQAGLVASQVHAGAYMGRYVVVVDDDVDIFDNDEFLWALVTRSDPERSIEIIKQCWSGSLDPAIPPDRKGLNSRCIIDACRPWEWKDQFPRVVTIGSELRSAVTERWGKVIF